MTEREYNNRGYGGILTSLQGITCKIPFYAVPFCMSTLRNCYMTMFVVDGKGHRDYSESPFTIQRPSYSNAIEVTDCEVIGNVDESVRDSLTEIASFISKALIEYYSASEVHTRLFFTLADAGLVLLDNSNAITVSNPPSASAQDKMTEQIQRELESFSTKRNVCCTNSQDCGPPKYKIAKLSVVLYRIDQRFPTAGERLLYQMVKSRISDPKEETVCCVRCYYVYAASDRIFECALRPDPLTFELPPQPFQPLVESEFQQRDKLPIISTVARANEPHRYALSLVESPYSRPPWLVAAPPHPSPPKRSIAIHVPRWAKRLCPNPGTTHKEARRPRTTQGSYEIPPPVDPIPVFLPAVTYSEGLATQLYGRAPFNVGFVDPRRRATLHTNGNAPNDRLPAFHA
jgi:hypothetical protein